MADPRRLPNLPAVTPGADDLIYVEQDGVSSRASLGELPVGTPTAQALAGKQPLDADLTAISALSTTPYGRSLLTSASVAALKTGLSLGNVDNTADADKPVSAATQAALEGRQPLDADLTAIAALTTTSYGRALLSLADAAAVKAVLGLVKGDVGLGEADNTSDAAKPVSTAMQTALDGKQPLDSDLTAIAALATTAYGRAVLTMANAAALKAVLSLAAADVSDFNTAADARITAQKGQNDGLASLDSAGKVPSSQLPALALTDVSSVSSQSAQLALGAQKGDVAIRTDLNKSYVHNGGSAGTMADWSELLTPTDAVLSVNGRIGAVTINSSDVTGALSYTPGNIANPLSQFSATTSAQLRGVISDETGTGALVFQGGDIGAATGASLALSGVASFGTSIGGSSAVGVVAPTGYAASSSGAVLEMRGYYNAAQWGLYSGNDDTLHLKTKSGGLGLSLQASGPAALTGTLSINGATIGSNALGVTGTTALDGRVNVGSSVSDDAEFAMQVGVVSSYTSSSSVRLSGGNVVVGPMINGDYPSLAFNVRPNATAAKYLASDVASRIQLTNVSGSGAFKFQVAPNDTAGNAITWTDAATLTSTGLGLGSAPSSYAGYGTVSVSGSLGGKYDLKVAGVLKGALISNASEVTVTSEAAIPVRLRHNGTYVLTTTSTGVNIAGKSLINRSTDNGLATLQVGTNWSTTGADISGTLVSDAGTLAAVPPGTPTNMFNVSNQGGYTWLLSVDSSTTYGQSKVYVITSNPGLGSPSVVKLMDGGNSLYEITISYSAGWVRIEHNSGSNKNIAWSVVRFGAGVTVTG